MDITIILSSQYFWSFLHAKENCLNNDFQNKNTHYRITDTYVSGPRCMNIKYTTLCSCRPKKSKKITETSSAQIIPLVTWAYTMTVFFQFRKISFENIVNFSFAPKKVLHPN